ncbi:hypothetical protein [Aquabacterium sp. OR-4]|uniref:hypothetical protein n=1 Tax=Aquabacterium sp. OR-4 TaxID=2978127 RepID=UPI0028CA77A9|nr:hypothetical protein [Aquabacterium sp. OR-4]MDT7837659.1 hypothetical protein [Aquabacterium sp. OR-4]
MTVAPDAPQPAAAVDLLACFAEFASLAPGRHRRQLGGTTAVLVVPAGEAPRSLTLTASGALTLRLPPGCAMAAAPGGGHVLSRAEAGAPSYWAPHWPRAAELDALGRLLTLEPLPIDRFEATGEGLSLSIRAPGRQIEWTLWQLPAAMAWREAGTLERSRWFMLGSHTVVAGRADVYQHLVAGTVFENRKAWPNDWRVFSENDGHALHLTLQGLARASGDAMLQALRRQVLDAVLARQSDDGGYRHGEWTQLMESHYRLHCSAMHLMMDALDEAPEPRVEQALRRAAAYLARQSVPLSFGHWLLHDELEHSLDAIRQSPLRWVPSRAFGKAESNMLVLNSHLDGMVALARYARLTGDAQYAPLLQSAHQATQAVLSLRPAEWLYKPLFALIGWTFLPVDRAMALPVWQRALKRLTWQRLIPLLPKIKARYPRFVMPGGYIDRDLSQLHWALDYHAINLMDLVRYLRHFDDAVVRQVLLESLDFTHASGLVQRWMELGYRSYAVGFWVEALCHACQLMPAEAKYRRWLAEAVLLLQDAGMGLPPSVLGANGEAVPASQQLPCPEPADAALRIVNLGTRAAPELLVVNTGKAALALQWARPPQAALAWHDADGRPVPAAGAAVPPQVPARGWLWGRAAH